MFSLNTLASFVNTIAKVSLLCSWSH